MTAARGEPQGPSSQPSAFSFQQAGFGSLPPAFGSGRCRIAIFSSVVSAQPSAISFQPFTIHNSELTPFPIFYFLLPTSAFTSHRTPLPFLRAPSRAVGDKIQSRGAGPCADSRFYFCP